MLNFTGLLKAPEHPSPLALYVATYNNGFGLQRREITAPSRFVALAIASTRIPDGFTLSHLRRQRGKRTA